MPHMVPHLKIAKDSHIVLGGRAVGFSTPVLTDHDRIFRVVVDVIIVVDAAGTLAAVFLFDDFVNHRAVPCGGALSADYLEQRNGQEHPADAKAD